MIELLESCKIAKIIFYAGGMAGIGTVLFLIFYTIVKLIITIFKLINNKINKSKLEIEKERKLLREDDNNAK